MHRRARASGARSEDRMCIFASRYRKEETRNHTHTRVPGVICAGLFLRDHLENYCFVGSRGVSPLHYVTMNMHSFSDMRPRAARELTREGRNCQGQTWKLVSVFLVSLATGKDWEISEIIISVESDVMEKKRNKEPSGASVQIIFCNFPICRRERRKQLVFLKVNDLTRGEDVNDDSRRVINILLMTS